MVGSCLLMPAFRSENVLGVVDLAIEVVVPQEAAGVGVEHGVAHAAPQALRVPTPLGHLEDVAVCDDIAAQGALRRLCLQRVQDDSHSALQSQ